jgi:hypothetical protein
VLYLSASSPAAFFGVHAVAGVLLIAEVHVVAGDAPVVGVLLLQCPCFSKPSLLLLAFLRVQFNHIFI